MRFANFKYLLILGLLLSFACSSQVEAQGSAKYEFGKPYPGGLFENLNPAEGQPAKINMATVLGKKPVILYYWVPGNPISETMFKDLEKVVAAQRGKVILIGVAIENPPTLTKQMISERIASLGIGSSVIHDTGYNVMRGLEVRTVPNVTIIDQDGILRLTAGASLKQQVEYGMTLKDAIVRVAEKGTIGTYRALPRYYAVEELKGESSPEFTAARLSDGVMQRSKSLFKDDEINVLLFWSVDCGHCKKHMPVVNDYMKSQGAGINLISAARVDNANMKTRTKEYAQFNKLIFPTVVDQDRSISKAYKVTATPTMVIISPDGTVEDVLVSGRDFEPVLERLKKKYNVGS